MFQFTKTPLEWLILIEPQIFADSRGGFMESYSQKEFQFAWIDCSFVQENQSMSHAGVLRGLHFQTQHTQAKLIQVTAGSIYDISVDLRKNSPSFGKYYGVVLSASNKKQVFIPKWFAHGFLSLEDNTQVLYKCDDFYDTIHDTGIAYDDSFLNIDWEKYCKKERIILSERDKNNMSFMDFCKNNPF
jgi:dTDP-4-dehydrorhamnose 3,5-epimerase